MMRNLHYIFMLAVLSSCIGVEKKQVSFSLIKEVTLLNSSLSFEMNSALENNQLFLWDYKSMKHKMYHLNSTQDTIKGSELASFDLSDSYYSDFYYYTKDSVYTLDNTNQLLLSINGEVTTNSISDSFNIAATSEIPICGNKKEIVFGNYYNGNVFVKENRKKYYNTKPIILYDIVSSTVKNIGYFPSCYTKDYANYYDYFPWVCLNKSGIAYAFDADHHIYLYEKGKEIEQIEVKSNYIKYFIPFDDSKMYDLNYSKTYHYEEPRYKRLIYDKYNNYYYRICKLRSVKIQGELNKKENWSIIVLNNQGEILGEHVFSNKEYTYQIIFPSSEGLYVSKAIPPNKNLVLSLLKLNIHE
jgi:hypothetical protein